MCEAKKNHLVGPRHRLWAAVAIVVGVSLAAINSAFWLAIRAPQWMPQWIVLPAVILISLIAFVFVIAVIWAPFRQRLFRISRFQFSLRTTIVFTTYVAVICMGVGVAWWDLPWATVAILGATLVIIGATAIRAVFEKSANRVYCSAFAIAAITYLAPVMVPWDYLGRGPALPATSPLGFIQNCILYYYPSITLRRMHLQAVLQSLLCLGLGFAAGHIGRWTFQKWRAWSDQRRAPTFQFQTDELPAQQNILRAFGVLVAIFAVINIYPLVVSSIPWVGLPTPAPVQWSDASFFLWGLESVLMAIWLCLAAARLWTLVLFFVLSFALLGATAYVGVETARPGGWGSLPFALTGTTAFLVGHSAVLGYFRWVRGWRLVNRDWQGVLPTGRPLRFKLSHLFIATVVAGATKAAQLRWPFVGGLIRATILGLIVALVVVPTLALLLGSGRSRHSQFIDGAIIAGMGALIYLLDSQSRNRDLTTFVSIWYAGLAASIVWLRSCGMRLRHAGEYLKA